MDKPTALRPYQLAGIEFLKAHPHAYLADSQGLGKSVQLIKAAQGKTLIIAPAMLVDSGMWKSEVEKWADNPEDFTITAYSRLAKREGRKLTTQIAEGLDQEWGTVIGDEAHYLVSRDSARSKMFRKIAAKADRVHLASGTPVPNYPHELFVPLQILHPEETRAGMTFGSYWRWIERWFETKPSFYGSSGALDIGRLRGCTDQCDSTRDGVSCEHYAAFSMANLRGKMLRRLRDDVLTDLPELQHIRVPVPMTTKQWTEYRSMRETYIAEVADSEVIAWSGASRHMTLDRLTTGVGAVGGDDLTAHSGKFERLREDLLGRTRPTLVVAHFRRSVDGAAEVARELGKSVGVIHGGTSREEREQIVTDFQAGKLDVLCGSFDTISEGLTLTSADLCILLELSYKAARNEQAIRRIHRMGQTRSCLVYEYFAVGPKGQRTLDAHKRDLVDRKIDGAEKTLTAATVKSLL